MSAFFLDILHIADAIVSLLLPSERLACLCVNSAWCDALVPIYWRDVVLFRKTKASRLNLVLESECTNLTELYVVVEILKTKPSSAIDNVVGSGDLTSTSPPDQRLDDIAIIVARNPHLRALSIDNVEVYTDGDLDELLRFVKFLNSYPGITGFYVGLRRVYGRLEHLRLAKTLQAVLDHRLDLLHDPSTVSRSAGVE
ncbi:hypothetical protein BGZ74_000449 [Mortierella antarctica]|nr:hypothetical protein BGZ74_000449 [Mortierella antarctica]